MDITVKQHMINQRIGRDELGNMIVVGTMISDHEYVALTTWVELFYIWFNHFEIESAVEFFVTQESPAGIKKDSVRQFILNDKNNPMTTEDKVYFAAVEL